jgi:hypothetical protein
MAKDGMDLNVTGGRWESACMKCFTARHPFMQSHWWKRMEK